MSTLPLKVIVATLAAAFALATPATAEKARKHKKVVVASKTVPIRITGERIWCRPGRCILAMSISVTILIRISASSSCGTSAAA